MTHQLSIDLCGQDQSPTLIPTFLSPMSTSTTSTTSFETKLLLKSQLLTHCSETPPFLHTYPLSPSPTPHFPPPNSST